MKSAAFIKIISEAYRVEEKTVALFARFLKDAEFMTSGGRGRHAPHMTPLDAARITIALLATDRPRLAVARLDRFRNLEFQPEQSCGPFPERLDIGPGATLEEVLTALFASDLEHDRVFDGSPYLEIQENARTATIEFNRRGDKRGAMFRDTKRSEAQLEEDRGDLFGIRQSRGLASAELTQAFVPFYCERRDGKPWEELQEEAEARMGEEREGIPASVGALLSPYIAGGEDDG